MKLIKIGFFLLFIHSCAPSRFVKPLQKNEKAINLSLGGELIRYGNTVIPIPFTSIVYGQGITDKTTVFGSIHTTSALFGNFQTDIGIVQQLYKNDSLKIGISASPALNFMCHQFKSDARLFPQLDLNFYWNYSKNKNYLYAGISNWFDFTKTKAHKEKQKNHYFFAPQIGHTFVKQKWNYNLELKYISPNLRNNFVVADYYNPFGSKGVIGIYIGISRTF